MPFVRIDVRKETPVSVTQTISEVVYSAMTDLANVPADDKFQVITRHASDELVYPANGYLGVTYSPGIVFIQITWNAGRTVDVKKAFYKRIADELHAKAGIRREDVFINIVEVAKENWSFGNGEMQYGPKP